MENTDKKKKHADYTELSSKDEDCCSYGSTIKRINAGLCLKIVAFVIVFSMVFSATHNRLGET